MARLDMKLGQLLDLYTPMHEDSWTKAMQVHYYDLNSPCRESISHLLRDLNTNPEGKFRDPIIIDTSDGTVNDGHHRVMAYIAGKYSRHADVSVQVGYSTPDELEDEEYEAYWEDPVVTYIRLRSTFQTKKAEVDMDLFTLLRSIWISRGTWLHADFASHPGDLQMVLHWNSVIDLNQIDAIHRALHRRVGNHFQRRDLIMALETDKQSEVDYKW